MEIWQIVWGLTVVVGMVAAGLTGSAFALMHGEMPGLAVFERRDIFLLGRTMMLVIYAPLGLIRAGVEAMVDEPMFALLFIGFGTIWSFFQGVFILTTFFGFT